MVSANLSPNLLPLKLLDFLEPGEEVGLSIKGTQMSMYIKSETHLHCPYNYRFTFIYL